MARTKEFDPDVALEQAMELFWRQGYESTSMADLVSHLGVARASLYSTFGSKHDLYMAALRRYLQPREVALVQSLSGPGPVLPLIRAVVEKWGDEVARDADRRGCLVVNAAIELGARDPGVAHCVEMSWRIMETTLTSALLRAQHAGELLEHRDPRALASFLVVMLQGMRVIARVAPDTDRLQGATDQALAALT